MDHIECVTVVNGLDQLPKYAACLGFLEFSLLIHILLELAAAGEFHDDDQGGVDDKRVLQLYDVSVVQFSEDTHLLDNRSVRAHYGRGEQTVYDYATSRSPGI